MLLTEYNEAEVMELFKEDGRKEGREEGRKEGREEGKILARYEDGMPVEQIAQKSGVSVEEVKKVLRDAEILV